jgi:hypothetical protein
MKNEPLTPEVVKEIVEKKETYKAFWDSVKA